jgi:phage gp36-like protein
MATYTTLTQLQRRIDPAILAGLADDINAPPDIDDPETIAVIDQAITDGASLIDSYLLGRVDLSAPLTQAALERLNATLALYFLYQRRYLDDALNPLGSSKELVLDHLAAVSRGAAKLADGDDGSPEMLVFSTTEDVKREVDALKF